jgi:hypothetical protein
MKPTYEEVESIFGEGCIKATYEDGRVLLIPTDPANSDYQAYLKWLDDPNAPTAFLHQPLVEG